MKEDLIKFLWEQNFFAGKELLCTQGKRLFVSKVGTKNLDAGPDFFNARLKINNLEWAGNIEIHVKTSDWFKHKHQNDKNYNNVILHVVFENDVVLKNDEGKQISTLEIKSLLPPLLLAKYSQLMLKQNSIACQKIFTTPSSIKMSLWLERLLIERLEQKTNYIKLILLKNENNFEQTFYLITAKYFGQKVNAQAFEMLAQTLPLQVIAKHKNNLSQIEALVLGTAGFLNQNIEDKYLIFLQQEYTYLKHKYTLNTLDKSIWKFARTRPSNFPTVRLIQFALFLFQNTHLLSKLIETEKVEDTHIFFDLKHKHKINIELLHRHNINALPKEYNIGKSTAQSIIINAFVPMLFTYGKIQNNNELVTKSMDWLTQMPAENNAITRLWKDFNIIANNALQSQALIEQKNNYCDKRQCLKCIIGKEILMK